MTKSRGINRPRHVWTDLDLQILRVGYPDLPTKQIAQDLGLSVDMVFRKATSLGLKKSDAYLASEMSGRIQRGRQDPRLVATQFKKGQEPPNKGLKGWDAGGRSAETRFRKGNKPHTWVPVGSYRVVNDKSGRRYLERKLNDLPGPNTVRWKPVHRLVWVEAHGPIPAGHMVVFKPGMATVVLEEITDDRLECISRAENARRNVPTAKHPEVARLIQLKGAITRQVNRINQEANQKETNP